MTVTIELSDEQALALKAKGAARGLSLEDWFQKLAMEMPTGRSRDRKGRYSLSELMEQCDLNAPLSEEEGWTSPLPAARRYR